MQIEMIYIPSICESNCLNAIADPSCTRNDVAYFYGDCLRCPYGREPAVDYKRINLAILARWPKGLNFIKNAAHREF